MPNTEKPTTIAAKKQQGIVKTPKIKSNQAKTLEPKNSVIKKNEKSPEEDKKEKREDKKIEKKKESKKQVIKKIKKEEVVVNAKNLHISTKKSAAICKFLKGKKIETAIEQLEEVLKLKRAIPMKGEIPHKKGRIMSGRYPQNAVKEFLVLLKSLQGNANNHDVEEPVIVEAIANIGERPLGRFGRWKRKRTHIRIVAREKKMIKNKERKKI